jgi:hypothetical protein
MDGEVVVEGPFEVDFDEAAVGVFGADLDVFAGLGSFGGAVEGDEAIFDSCEKLGIYTERKGEQVNGFVGVQCADGHEA